MWLVYLVCWLAGNCWYSWLCVCCCLPLLESGEQRWKERSRKKEKEGRNDNESCAYSGAEPHYNSLSFLLFLLLLLLQRLLLLRQQQSAPVDTTSSRQLRMTSCQTVATNTGREGKGREGKGRERVWQLVCGCVPPPPLKRQPPRGRNGPVGAFDTGIGKTPMLY